MLTRRNIPQDINNRFNALLANNSPEFHLIHFLRNELTTASPPEKLQIFQILTGGEFQGAVPEINQNFNIQIRQGSPSRNRSRSRGRSPDNQTMAAATTSYFTNPYLGNINPGDPNGSKLYIKAREELSKDNKIEIKVENAHKFIDQV